MRGDGFFEKTLFFEYLRKEGKGKRKRRMIVSGYVFFWMIFLLFAFSAVAAFAAFAVDVDVCSVLWGGN